MCPGGILELYARLLQVCFVIGKGDLHLVAVFQVGVWGNLVIQIIESGDDQLQLLPHGFQLFLGHGLAEHLFGISLHIHAVGKAVIAQGAERIQLIQIHLCRIQPDALAEPVREILLVFRQAHRAVALHTLHGDGVGLLQIQGTAAAQHGNNQHRSQNHHHRHRRDADCLGGDGLFLLRGRKGIPVGCSRLRSWRCGLLRRLRSGHGETALGAKSCVVGHLVSTLLTIHVFIPLTLLSVCI